MLAGQHAQARHLRDGQVDEHDAAPQHLTAQWHVAGQRQQAGGQRRQQQGQLVHRGFVVLSSAAISESIQPSSVALAPPSVTVLGSASSVVLPSPS